MDQVIVKAPSSKSVSHRRLIGAALARGESRLSGVLESRDIEQTRSVLEDTGARFERIAPGEWRVLGMGGGRAAVMPSPYPVMCMNPARPAAC